MAQYNAAFDPFPVTVLPLTSGLSWIDLEFLGHRRAIATVVVQGSAGVALIDPGPTTTRGTLERQLERGGIRLRDVTDILLTHIHLDHAGVTGVLVREYPHLRVHVHERGAPHLVDPAKLLQSATRLWGDQMGRLWGEVVPVPASRIVALTGGERLDAGGRTFEVAYTPGHASHHVSYFDASSGVAFVGDTAGVCVDGGYVLPPTPPPDIELDLWRASVARIEGWSPSTLFLTHCGPVMSVGAHLRTLLDHLSTLAEMARETLGEPGTDDERAARFVEALRREMRRAMSEAQAQRYEAAAPLELSWRGLARYWKTRGAHGDQTPPRRAD